MPEIAAGSPSTAETSRPSPPEASPSPATPGRPAAGGAPAVQPLQGFSFGGAASQGPSYSQLLQEIQTRRVK